MALITDRSGGSTVGRAGKVFTGGQRWEQRRCSLLFHSILTCNLRALQLFLREKPGQATSLQRTHLENINAAARVSI